MLGVVFYTAVEESRLEPLESNGDVRDSVEDNLCIQVLNEIAMEAMQK